MLVNVFAVLMFDVVIVLGFFGVQYATMEKDEFKSGLKEMCKFLAMVLVPATLITLVAILLA